MKQEAKTAPQQKPLPAFYHCVMYARGYKIEVKNEGLAITQIWSTAFFKCLAHTHCYSLTDLK